MNTPEPKSNIDNLNHTKSCTLDEILNMVRWGDYQDSSGKWNRGVANKPEIHQLLQALIAKAVVEARIDELVKRQADLSWACGYTDDQPFLKRELEIVTKQLNDLQGGKQ